MTERKAVLVENFLEENPNRVCVYEYNDYTDSMLVDIEVCSKDEAFNKYNVVGEIREGFIKLYEEDDFDDHLDLYDEEFEELDDE